MSPVATCPKCGSKTRLPDNGSGSSVTCTACQHGFVPTPEPAGDDLSVWVDGPAAPVPAQAATPEVSPPSLVDPADAEGQLDWLRKETERFQQYVAAELATIEHRRLELAAAEERARTATFLRQHELNRQASIHASRLRSIEKREEAVRQREADQAKTADELGVREAELQDVETRLLALAERTDELERRAQELTPVVESLEAQKAEGEALWAALAEQRVALELRHGELDQRERTLRRRTEEPEPPKARATAADNPFG